MAAGMEADDCRRPFGMVCVLTRQTTLKAIQPEMAAYSAIPHPESA
jgi:hypothetical protein